MLIICQVQAGHLPIFIGDGSGFALLDDKEATITGFMISPKDLPVKILLGFS